MKRLAVASIVLLVTSVGLTPAAGAVEQNQPSQGAHSLDRNDAGFGGGPHCHLVVVDSGQEQFEHIRVYPSHTGHANSGATDGPLAADSNCDGDL